MIQADGGVLPSAKGFTKLCCEGTVAKGHGAVVPENKGELGGFVESGDVHSHEVKTIPPYSNSGQLENS